VGLGFQEGSGFGLEAFVLVRRLRVAVLRDLLGVRLLVGGSGPEGCQLLGGDRVGTGRWAGEGGIDGRGSGVDRRFRRDRVGECSNLSIRRDRPDGRDDRPTGLRQLLGAGLSDEPSS
jgi:hypothetical protein